jgi:hypothetical protein
VSVTEPRAPLTLRQMQSLFVRLVADLIREGTAQGFEFTFGEAWRTPEQAARNAAAGIGSRNSLHIDRLAIDLNLFRAGQFLTSTEAHRPLGEWWEKRHPLCRWGGRFNDGNHYSLEWQGRK